MPYTVVVRNGNKEARLGCKTIQEAVLLKQSYVNYGKYQSVEIEHTIIL